MFFAIKLSYNKSNTPNEVESQQGKKRAGLSFELSVIGDSLMLHLISSGIADVINIIHNFMT